MKGGSISLLAARSATSTATVQSAYSSHSPRAALKYSSCRRSATGPMLAGTDGPVVHLDDGCDLEPRPREEHLVGGVELRAVHRHAR